MANHPLDGFLLKLNRAETHLESVHQSIEKFVRSDYYETSTEYDYKRRLVARLKNVQPPPAELSVLIGDTVFNLRSALDQLAYGLAATYTRPLPEPVAWTSAFPIFSSGRRYRTGGRGGAAYKMRGMSHHARAAIGRVQPFHKRKNPMLVYLWMLEELCNIDKHRLVHLTTAATHAMSFQVSGTGFLRLDSAEVIPRPIEDGAVVARLYGQFEAPPAVQVKMNLVPDVRFHARGEAKSVRGRSVLETLYGIRDAILFSVLPELDDELARLFPGGRLMIDVKESGVFPPPPSEARAASPSGGYA